MIASHKARRRKYGVFVLAIALFVVGCAGLIIGFHRDVIRMLGILVLVASVYLVKISNVHDQIDLSVGKDQDKGSEVAEFSRLKRPGAPLWIASAASLVALGVSYLYLYWDALAGYHEVLPVYAFATVGLICIAVWGALILKLSSPP
jgi:NADH:ubiquinone oxidoreductase subunit 2 (subunit N)